MKIEFIDTNTFDKQTLTIGLHLDPKVQLCYNRVINQNGKKITQEYVNGKLASYYVAESNTNFRILKGYSAHDKQFFTQVTYMDTNGKPYMDYSEVITDKEELEICYRAIDENGNQSLEAYEDYFSCYYRVFPIS